MKIVLTSVLSFALCSAGLLKAADPAVSGSMSNGIAWNGLGGGDAKTATMLKFIYLVGLGDGFVQGRDELSASLTGLAASSGRKRPEGVRDTAGDVIPMLLPNGKDYVFMIASLNELYADRRNLDIPIPMAVRLVKASFEAQLKDLEAELQRLRSLYKVSRELDSLQAK